MFASAQAMGGCSEMACQIVYSLCQAVHWPTFEEDGLIGLINLHPFLRGGARQHGFTDGT